MSTSPRGPQFTAAQILDSIKAAGYVAFEGETPYDLNHFRRPYCRCDSQHGSTTGLAVPTGTRTSSGTADPGGLRLIQGSTGWRTQAT